MHIGVFGGSFDPPHLGHLIVAQDAREQLGLDRILFVPANHSPLKAGDGDGAPAELRYAMVREAIRGRRDFEVSREELDRAPPSYTVDTLRALRARETGTRYALLIGADQWAVFDRWKEPEEIGTLAEVVVLTREGEEVASTVAGVTPRILSVTRVDVSSTDVRRRLREGRSVRYLVPEVVRDLIEANGLYVKC